MLIDLSIAHKLMKTTYCSSEPRSNKVLEYKDKIAAELATVDTLGPTRPQDTSEKGKKGRTNKTKCPIKGKWVYFLMMGVCLLVKRQSTMSSGVDLSPPDKKPIMGWTDRGQSPRLSCLSTKLAVKQENIPVKLKRERSLSATPPSSPTENLVERVAASRKVRVIDNCGRSLYSRSHSWFG